MILPQNQKLTIPSIEGDPFPANGGIAARADRANLPALPKRYFKQTVSELPGIAHHDFADHLENGHQPLSAQ